MSNSGPNEVETVDEGSLEGVKIVTNRDGRLPKGILLPLAIMIVAGAALAIRAAVHDWRGLPRKPRPALVPCSRARKPVANPKVAEKAKPDPVAIAKADVPAPKAEAPQPPAAWDEIHREAEKKEAEKKEAEKLKADAEAKLAQLPYRPANLAIAAG